MTICGALLLLLGVSCQKKQANFSTDEVKMTDAKHLIVNDDTTFTGELWDEGHRQCIELKNGQKTKITFTHANGQKAAVYKYPYKGSEAESHFYDEDGKEITQMEFGKRYHNIIEEFGDN